MNIALWQTNLSFPVLSLQDWLSLVEAQCALASEDNCQFIMMPEHISAMWLQFAPELKPSDELEWLSYQSLDVFEPIQTLAEKYNINILAGSWPFKDEDGFTNRAYLFSKNHNVFFHDKLCMTPEEVDSQAWNMKIGKHIQIIHIDDIKIAILICLDSELPYLSTLLSQYEIDLLLIPSMTSYLSGYHRVFSCAKARAVELFCSVAVVGCDAENLKPFLCVGGAAVFIPCERSLGDTGIYYQSNAVDNSAESQAAGTLHIIKDIPIQKIKQIKMNHNAEVWPGHWQNNIFIDAVN